ncbi:MAG: Rieske 2Fe-2S domain-containing protein [Myxococcales bacterium]|nr:Rieske 2Fe-2S domain-containing protein [Myxococcales bacterium]
MRTRPPPFPNCWFHLAAFSEFKDDEIRSFKFLGHDIIAFKTGDDSITVMDAYCPHLGAHLGRDAKGKNNRLKNGCVQCPYHHLTFDAEGTCVEGPGQASVPKAKVFTWETEIVEGLVFVYHHKDKLPSTWKISEFFHPQGTWSRPYKSYQGVHPIHPQDAAENSVDTLHFRTLHQFHRVDQVTEAVADRQHFYQTLHIGKMGILPKLMRNVPIYSEVTEAAVGVGFPMAHNRFHPSGLQVNHLVFLTPIDETSTNFWFYFQVSFDDVKVPRFLRKRKAQIERLLHERIKRAVDRAVHRAAYTVLSPMFVLINSQDLDIWSNKSYCDKPVVLGNDGNIRSFRKWCKQFY